MEDLNKDYENYNNPSFENKNYTREDINDVLFYDKNNDTIYWPVNDFN